MHNLDTLDLVRQTCMRKGTYFNCLNVAFDNAVVWKSLPWQGENVHYIEYLLLIIVVKFTT
jgi:hypothetical protein